MSQWLKPLNLLRNIRLETNSALHGRELPEWASFLIWAGWWMRSTRRANTRIFMIVLLPTRVCCSAICSLGALIGSMAEAKDSLSWERFLSLPVGTKIYWHECRKKQVGTIIEKVGAGVKVKFETKHKRFREASQVFFERHFSECRISLTPFLSGPEEEILGKVKSFYSTIASEFSDTWVSSWSSDCLLVTNMAGWKREVEGLFVADDDNDENRILLSDAVMWWLNDEIHEPRVRLSSPKSIPPNSNEIPLAILDGPDALRSREMVWSQNTIVLLDQTEYDESSQNLLAQLLSIRNDDLLPLPEGVPDTLPYNTEMLMFAVEASDY